MEDNQITENLKFVLQRIDLNVDRTNTKSTILLGIATFFIGSLSQNLSFIKEIISLGLGYKFLFIISIFGLTFTSYYSIKAIVPKFTREKKSSDNSLIYYGSINNLDSKEYYKIMNSKEYDFNTDLCGQIIANGKIAYNKFLILKKAFSCLIYMVIFPWILTFAIILIRGEI